MIRERMLWPWHEWPIVVVDFETTGADPATCAPVEVALVRIERGQQVLAWASLVNPGVPIPEAAAAIHGISDADVKDAPNMAEAMAAAPDAMFDADVIPCAYSSQFDRAIMHRWMSAMPGHSVALLDTAMQWLDPLVIIRHVDRFAPGKGRHRLGTTCERHGVLHESAHRALGDAEATGRLLFSPVIREALGDMTIGEVLRRQQERAVQQERDFAAWKARQPQQDGATP